MEKTARKVGTNEESIKKAEASLGFVFPKIVRNKLLSENGFDWGWFWFYGVKDDEDLVHTFDDVVRANTQGDSAWEKFLPEGYVAIADDGGNGCLVVKKDSDGKVYYWDHIGEMSVFAENEELFERKLNQEEKELEED